MSLRRLFRWLQPIGNDGLRKWERDEMAAHYMATLGKTPTVSVFDTEGGKAFVDNLRRITPEADRMIAEARRQEHR